MDHVIEHIYWMLMCKFDIVFSNFFGYYFAFIQPFIYYPSFAGHFSSEMICFKIALYT